LVVGATFPHEITRVRAIAPHAPLLIPGVGAQGGDALAAVGNGWRADAPIVVNSSRAILYAGRSVDEIGPAARSAASKAREVLRPPR
jgi:orotidine-5'-phosphate decarboxylase